MTLEKLSENEVIGLIEKVKNWKEEKGSNGEGLGYFSGNIYIPKDKEKRIIHVQLIYGYFVSIYYKKNNKYEDILDIKLDGKKIEDIYNLIYDKNEIDKEKKKEKEEKIRNEYIGTLKNILRK